MVRKTRESLQTEYNHVTIRGIGRRAIFEDNTDKERFLSALAKILPESGAEILAWCLMDNHAHLLVLASSTDLSKLMQRLGTSYAQYYNGRHGHVGKVFQNRFDAHPIADDAHLLTVIRYIHENALDTGASNPADYTWSSFREIAGIESSKTIPLVNSTAVLNLFGGFEDFLRFHEKERTENEVVWLDGRRPRINDSEARDIAIRLYGESFTDIICSMPKERRNAALASLKTAGLSVRQIERLTGIGRGIVTRA